MTRSRYFDVGTKRNALSRSGFGLLFGLVLCFSHRTGAAEIAITTRDELKGELGSLREHLDQDNKTRAKREEEFEARLKQVGPGVGPSKLREIPRMLPPYREYTSNRLVSHLNPADLHLFVELTSDITLVACEHFRANITGHPALTSYSTNQVEVERTDI